MGGDGGGGEQKTPRSYYPGREGGAGMKRSAKRKKRWTWVWINLKDLKEGRQGLYVSKYDKSWPTKAKLSWGK